MIPLVTLTEVKLQISIAAGDTSRDDLIQMKILEASAIVMDYLKQSSVPDAWVVGGSPITYDVPGNIKSVALMVAGELVMNREASAANVLSDAVCRLLQRSFDPALA